MTADFGSAMIALGAEHAGLRLLKVTKTADVQFGVALAPWRMVTDPGA